MLETGVEEADDVVVDGVLGDLLDDFGDVGNLVARNIADMLDETIRAGELPPLQRYLNRGLIQEVNYHGRVEVLDIVLQIAVLTIKRQAVH